MARARQLAISQHTTVYMVFVPTNFWDINFTPGNFNNTWFNSLSAAEKTAATNLCDKQLSGYTFMADGAIGDQPGQHKWHYLAPWQNLPDGTFIVTNKFDFPGNVVSSFSNPFFSQWNVDYPHSDQNRIYAFTNVAVPFPTEDTVTNIFMPCIAFNYLGQLTLDGQNPAGRDEYIPLARGSVLPAHDAATKAFQFNPPQVSEIRPATAPTPTTSSALTG